MFAAILLAICVAYIATANAWTKVRDERLPGLLRMKLFFNLVYKFSYSLFPRRVANRQ